ncbi:MAG: hypothetical protein KA250_13575 [Verrucomicrobiales bacterium]|nr:hypothetical protein [Verrucomicrobiales bacterium]
MRKFIPLILICFSLLAGCGDGGKAEIERERQRTEQAERERQKAEQARKEAEEGKSTWQTVAWVVGVGAVVLLVFGTAMGSSARKDAEKKAGETNE